jgi:hypothetical protein
VIDIQQCAFASCDRLAFLDLPEGCHSIGPESYSLYWACIVFKLQIIVKHSYSIHRLSRSGTRDGPEVGPEEVGPEVGPDVGAELGVSLGMSLGAKEGTSLGTSPGASLGTTMSIGALLGV